ncbi:MAG: hypothetical protein IK137_02740 [Bacilli bacterium]|nr:hypothetical protein [Bacilli bacterium]
MSNKKKFFIIFLFIILDAFLLVGYLVIRDKTNLNNLKKEVNELNKLDLTKDAFNRRIKTSGDYALVEKTIKTYLIEYSKGIQEVKGIMNDSKLTKILSYDNYSTDGFEFNESFKYLSSEKEEFNKEIDSLIEKSNEKYINNYIDKKIEDNYYNELCKELLITKKRIKSLEETKKTLEEIKPKVNNIIDTSTEVLNLIKDNKDNCILEEGQIKFKSKAVYDKYNELISKIKED